MKDSSEHLQGSDHGADKIGLPEGLQDWRPACGMREELLTLPVCRKPATHSLNDCDNVVLTCLECHQAYMDYLRHEVSTFPKAKCKACEQGVDLLLHLQLKKL
ncbi:hypothetical protein SEA_EJIMIX_97 [Mycobacterium phage Ejimix]|uniref:hypothetical protein n=1 Tax=Mycobacterium phage Redno2 TaxID=1340709 RepID=UPI000387A76E|nr:hypothetical protein N860_gp095 [Mycobacterium phage Redno2]YP_009124056.1 hypothetical protein VC71_gp103 [Mycobacterium phage Minerva]ATN88912.1 hypothetical protein SEA_DMPSTRDIVER_105 [Mycobacterium phage DmpstrDiver]AWH13916.1 hypothetical protein SEA_HALLEY_105 [Mycobacterium phage Halley]AXQ52098.1 hypothetical protein SEA_EJIMIX_97 [Mycobacterium phage Ejimix]QBJ00055.1 hypothetical protein SEA_PHOEBUS_105 [Mycobacterium phage Phoebus]QCO93788.1 hypothetical protein SEA_SCHATZIE_98